MREQDGDRARLLEVGREAVLVFAARRQVERVDAFSLEQERQLEEQELAGRLLPVPRRLGHHPRQHGIPAPQADVGRDQLVLDAHDGDVQKVRLALHGQIERLLQVVVTERERVMRRALPKLVEGNDLVEERGERVVVADALEREAPAARQPTELALVRLLAQRGPDRVGGVGRQIRRRDRAPEASGAPSLRRGERHARGDEEKLQPPARERVGEGVERGSDEPVIGAEPDLVFGVVRADVTERGPVVAHREQEETGERRVRPAGDDDRRETGAIRPIPDVGERRVLKRGRPRTGLIERTPRIAEPGPPEQVERGVPSSNLEPELACGCGGRRLEQSWGHVVNAARGYAHIPSYTRRAAALGAATSIGRRVLPERPVPRARRVLYWRTESR